MARIEHTLVAQPDRHIAHGIDAFGHRFHRKFHQLIGHLGQPIERLTHRIHRPGADRRLAELGAIRSHQGDGGGGLQASATAHLHALEGEAAAILLLHLLAHDRLEIAVADFPLAIRELLEAGEGIVEILTLERVAQLLEPGPEGAAAAQLAKGDAVVGQTDRAGINDFVGEAVFEHAVLVDATLVSKGVGAHDRLIGLHRHAGEIAHQPRGLGDLLGAHARERFGALGGPPQEGVEVAAPHVQGHHQLLERGIASPLADAVDRALQLAGAVFHRLEEVGHRQAQVVVAMHRDHRLVDVGHLGIDTGDQLTEFRRGGVAHGVGDVDRGGTGADRRLDHLMHELRIAAAGVFAGELHIVDQRAGVGHHLGGDRQHLGAALAQLVLEMDVAGGNKGVDAPLSSGRHRISAGLDVAGSGPSQAADHRPIGGANGFGNALHGVEVAGAGKGETGLDDVHPQPG